MAQIEWSDESLSLARCESILGTSHVERLRRSPCPPLTCESLAAGAWDANDREHYAAYRSLARIFSGECPVDTSYPAARSTGTYRPGWSCKVRV